MHHDDYGRILLIRLDCDPLYRQYSDSTGRAYKVLAPGTHWKWLGYLGVLAGFLILGYYSVVAGWTDVYKRQAIK